MTRAADRSQVRSPAARRRRASPHPAAALWTDQEPKAPSTREPVGSARARLELWLTALGGFVVSLCGTMIVPIIPELQRTLHTDAAGVSWTLTAATLMSAVSVPVMGRLGDMYGKKRLLVIAVGAAAVGSIICALSGTLLVLLIGRVIQGLASSAIPLGISLLAAAIAIQAPTRSHRAELANPDLGEPHGSSDQGDAVADESEDLQEDEPAARRAS